MVVGNLFVWRKRGKGLPHLVGQLVCPLPTLHWHAGHPLANQLLMQTEKEHLPFGPLWAYVTAGPTRRQLALLLSPHLTMGNKALGIKRKGSAPGHPEHLCTIEYQEQFLRGWEKQDSPF